MKKYFFLPIFFMPVKAIRCAVAAIFISFQILSSFTVHASEYLPQPGSMVLTTAAFEPVMMQAIKVFPNDPFKFDFIIDRGTGDFTQDQLKEESEKLVKYFLTSLTIPEKEMWVNLSPYEKDRIIPDGFGSTEMGREILAQDYILKQLAASLIHPEEESGKKFWDKVYERAYELYGAVDVPVETFHKVWIVPQKSSVFENADSNTTFVVDIELDVMLEDDYLALEHSKISEESFKEHYGEETDATKLSTQVMREVIIPVIRDEVNNGQLFASLRQIMHALVLATWYKRALKESVLGKAYVNQQKVDGIETSDINAKEEIYQSYLEAFRKGVFDFIKEEYDPVSQSVIPKKYFSGGIIIEKVKEIEELSPADEDVQGRLSDLAQLAQEADDSRLMVLEAGGALANIETGEFEEAKNDLLHPRIARGVSRATGVPVKYLQILQRLCVAKKWVMVLRNYNSAGARFLQKDTHVIGNKEYKNIVTKPVGCDAKTMAANGSVYEGLVTNPKHPIQAREWRSAIAHAKIAGDHARARRLQEKRREALETWDKYWPEMQRKGYSFDKNGVVGFRKVLENGDVQIADMIIPDFDIHDLFERQADGSLVRVDLGSGKNVNADGVDLDGLATRDEINEALGLVMINHGAEGNYYKKLKRQARPGVVVLSDEGRNPEVLRTYQQMEDFYQNVLQVEWDYRRIQRADILRAQVGLAKVAMHQIGWEAHQSLKLTSAIGGEMRKALALQTRNVSRFILQRAAFLAIVLMSVTFVMSGRVNVKPDALNIDSIAAQAIKREGDPPLKSGISDAIDFNYDNYGGIDLEKVDVDVQRRGDGVITAFDDPLQLEKLQNAKGLTPVVYDIKPLTLSVLNNVFGGLPVP